jgi:hypothetical protein
MEWKNIKQHDGGLIKVPSRWLQIHYYEALNMLFRFENSLRVFVYIVLKNEFFDKWAECNFNPLGADANSIKGLASKRIKQSDNFGYLGFDVKAPLMHLTSGELVELITSDAYWPKFKPYFKGNKEIIKNKLLEIGTIRNSLAHFRPMRPEDIDVVKQNSRHTLLGVEECLTNVFTQQIRVPTNTQDAWYKSMSNAAGQHLTSTLHYSKNEEWLNLKLTFTSPCIGFQRWGERYISNELIKIKPQQILLKNAKLKANATYATEYTNYPTLKEDGQLEVKKDINIVFKKSVIEAKHEEIHADIKSVIEKTEEECDLLKKDNLARGEYVEPISCYSWWQEPQNDQQGRWIHNHEVMNSPYVSNDPDEYWGQHLFVADPVAGCVRYPWMPENISNPDGFFD